MEFQKTEHVLSSMMEILRHINSVQLDVLELSERSALSFHTYIETHQLVLDAKTLEGFQFQDIISQQLNAVCETISMIQNNINVYMHAVKHDQNALGQSIERLSGKLQKSLDEARKKQEAFSGNAMDEHHGESLEFF